MTVIHTSSRLFIAASALALAACGGGNAPAESNTTDATTAAEQIESAAADAAGAAESAAAEAGDMASDAAGAATAAASDAADAAADAGKAATDAAGEMMDAAGETAGNAMESAEAAAGDAAEAAGDAAEAVEDAAAAATDGVDLSQYRTASAESTAAYEALTGDPANGRRVFTKCMSCHVVQEGQNRVGPSLYKVVGRESGSIEGFRYSNANKNSNIFWTEATMFEYLENPQEYISGTIMAFPGLPKPQDRADVIAYIKQESGQ